MNRISARSDRFSRYFSPSVLCLADFAGRDTPSSVRLQIELSKNGYDLQLIESVKSVRADYTPLTLAQSDSLEQVISLMKQEAVCFEQDGYDFVRSADYEPEQLDLNLFHWGRHTFMTSSQYLMNKKHSCGRTFVQALPAGLHCLISIDGLGVRLALSPHQSKMITEGAVFEQAMSLTRAQGFRAAVFEVIVSGEQLHILDVLYLNDRWLSDLPFSTRIEELSLFLNKNQMSSVSVVMPMLVQSSDWLSFDENGLRTAFLVRTNDSSYVTTRDNQAGFDALIVSERQAAQVTFIPAGASEVHVLDGDTMAFLFSTKISQVHLGLSDSELVSDPRGNSLFFPVNSY